MPVLCCSGPPGDIVRRSARCSPCASLSYKYLRPAESSYLKVCSSQRLISLSTLLFLHLICNPPVLCRQVCLNPQYRYREVTTPDRAQASITCGLAPVRLKSTKRKHKAVRIRSLQDYCILKGDTYGAQSGPLPRLYTCLYQGRTLTGVIGVQTVCTSTSYSFGANVGVIIPVRGPSRTTVQSNKVDNRMTKLESSGLRKGVTVKVKPSRQKAIPASAWIALMYTTGERKGSPRLAT